MVWGQQGAPSTDGNPYLDTTKGYYLNHVEPFATLLPPPVRHPVGSRCRGPSPLARCSPIGMTSIRKGMPRHPLFKQENADFVGPDVGTVVLETWIKSPKAQIVGAWIGFTGCSRARARKLPAKGEWGRHGATVEVNGEALPAPAWRHPGESRSIEQPFEDEEYYMREPTPLRLKAGWNHVKLTVPCPPKPTLDDSWTATFIPVLGDSRHPESVPGLVCACDLRCDAGSAIIRSKFSTRRK